MLLRGIATEQGSRLAAREAFEVMAAMYPLCRSITGDGVRRTLDIIEGIVPLVRHEVPSGTAVFDWQIPLEWNIRDAWIADTNGRRVVDFRESNLHVVGYSAPVRRTMTLAELEPHLYSLPDQPDLVPYRTTYWRDHWGFCLRHRDRLELGPGPYEVVVQSELSQGALTYAECVIPGETDHEAILYTHTCHPSLANDNLTGLAAAALLARDLLRERPRLTWRLVYGPGTIGSLTWLARNESLLPRLRCGLVIGLLGDAGALTYKRSRLGRCTTDRACEMVLQRSGVRSRVLPFAPYGYDERQFCSPGFDLPVGRLTRSPNGAYPEYHTSADNLELLDGDKFAESLRVLSEMVAVLDANRVLTSLSQKGEPRLGKRGLYGDVGGVAPAEFEHALLWLLSLGDGAHDIVDAAIHSGLDFQVLERAACALEGVGLLAGEGRRDDSREHGG